MSTEREIAVTFEVGGEVYAGVARYSQIVHEAMEKILPPSVLRAQRLRLTAQNGALIYPDMFLGEISEHYGEARFVIEATPLSEKSREWTNFGFDHLALAVRDRAHAREFFIKGLKMKLARDDAHLTVVTTGNTAIFLFDADPDAPMSDGHPSRIHHLGFVVDDLEAAFAHLKRTFPGFASDFTLLEREERFSLYGSVAFGGVRFLVQLSEIKPQYRGFKDGTLFTQAMYDYAAKDYGVRLG
jgi:catechol 2,3-dioxygenase-like lactoylglutathione lyase family enzyme